MKQKMFLFIIASLAVFSITASVTTALEPIPHESGFSGYIRPGAGYGSFKTNMVASFLGVEVSDKKVESLFDNPASKTAAFALIPFALAYTFAESRTQVFIGTEPTDLIRLDYSHQVGVKQEIGLFGIIQGGALFNPFPMEVWQDPYVAGYQERVETKRYSNGIRFVWDKLIGSQFQLQYTYRKIDLGRERSGEFLGLPAGQRDLLDRNGNRHSGEILYRFAMSPKHWLTPIFRYTRNDLKGDAMAGDAYAFQLNYSYFGDPFSVIANVFFGFEEYDEINPIYNRSQMDDHLGFQGAIYYKNPWGWRIFGSHPINFYLSCAFADVDSDIDFYDQQAVMATGGVLFKW